MKLIRIKCKDDSQTEQNFDKFLKIAKSFEGWKPLGKYGPLKKRSSYYGNILIKYTCGKPDIGKGYVDIAISKDGKTVVGVNDHLIWNFYEQEISNSIVKKIKNQIEKLLQEDEQNWSKILEQRRQNKEAWERRQHSW